MRGRGNPSGDRTADQLRPPPSGPAAGVPLHHGETPEEAGEPTYTLSQARRILRAELCLDAGGHELEQHVVSSIGGRPTAVAVSCSRCHATFTETPSP